MKTYSTNEICQLCSASRKQLRYYEERGLLSAVPRQSGNDYRYYTSEHIYEIVAAKALRNINMSTSEMKDIIYGNNDSSIQHSLQQQLDSAKAELDLHLRQYEQSAVVYAHLAEALSFLKLHSISGDVPAPEVISYPGQEIVSISYKETFEDELCMDVEYLPRIQSIAQNVNAVSIGSLIYITEGHFDSAACTFDQQIHDFKIAIPVTDQNIPCLYYDKIPPFRGVSMLHIGDPKNKRLYRSYMRLLSWAKEHNFELENHSVEEWLISPMITNNKELWVIRIMIPFKNI